MHVSPLANHDFSTSSSTSWLNYSPWGTFEASIDSFIAFALPRAFRTIDPHSNEDWDGVEGGDLQVLFCLDVLGEMNKNVGAVSIVHLKQSLDSRMP